MPANRLPQKISNMVLTRAPLFGILEDMTTAQTSTATFRTSSARTGTVIVPAAGTDEEQAYAIAAEIIPANWTTDTEFMGRQRPLGGVWVVPVSAA